MAILSKGETFGATDTVTSTRLHDLVENATFAAGAKDGVTIDIDTNGALFVKSISSGQLASDCVTPDKIDSLNSGVFAFKNASAQVHYSNQIAATHNVAGALTIDGSNGNFQFITVSANITSVAAITNASLLAGAHFTFLLKYSGTISGPGTGDWNSAWLFPSTYSGSLTMTNGTFDLISGVIFNDSGTYKYAVSSILNLTNP
jgi:hypothetical protein